MLKVVIYDLDGTLVDSRADLADAGNAMLERLGLPRRGDDEVASFVGEGAEKLVRRSLGPVHERRLAEAMPLWFSCYQERLVRQTRPYAALDAALALPASTPPALPNNPA